jgi:hypothetical protein
MMHSVLKTDLRFGVIFVGAGGASDVGCVREVAEHEHLAEDRFIHISGAVSCRPQQVLPRCHRGVAQRPQNRGDCLQPCELFSQFSLSVRIVRLLSLQSLFFSDDVCV